MALSLIRRDSIRRVVVNISALLLMIGSVWLLINNYGETIHFYKVESDWIGQLMLYVELGLAGFIFFMAAKYRKWPVIVLVLVQAGLGLWLEISQADLLEAGYPLFTDKFSLLMALIIGIIGSLIAVYALGYMRDFHAHNQGKMPDRRRSFFFIIFVFLSAMFGVVFSNDLLWLYFFWEITTICSFLLIAYRGTTESIDNAFRALGYNLLGGLAMLLGIVILFMQHGVIEMDKLLALGSPNILIPVMLLSIAGITKSAQLPFSSWLLGAMVAPTPVSALLHSSTMVKAGVYLLVKLGPVFNGTPVGLSVALVGGFTFLMTSLIAISQSDAKKVLAYSTIANLGLIVMCAGIGTYESIWAALLLIIFHAIAKCLLFLCVGSIEHTIGSRDIEDMDGLIVAMPKSAWLLLVGMAGMFLAPFGMLISKWAALVAVIDANPALTILLLYGSAATLFFWVKWMGKLLSVNQRKENVEVGISRTVWVPLYALGFMMIAVCLFFPYVSRALIEPYVFSIYGHIAAMSPGNILIMIMMMGLIFLFPFSLPGHDDEVKNQRLVDAYMGAANVPGTRRFLGAAGAVHEVSFRNYYLEKYFGEKVLLKPSILIACGLLVILLIGAAF